MAISGVATSGLISGLDVNGLISQMMAYEQRPISILQSRQQDYSIKIASLLSLSSQMSSYKSALDSLNDSEKFNTKSASVTNTSAGETLLTVSTSSEAAAGSYDISVNQIATASKKASQGWIDQNSTAITSTVGSFKFKVGISGAVTTIGVDSTTTLQGLRDKINNADAGVTATIIDDGTGSNPYRLIITADNMGSSNEIIITDDLIADQAAANLGFIDGSGGIPKIIEAAYAYSENTYSGTVASNNGNNYTGTTNKTFLIEAVSAGAVGTATYKYSIDGGISWLGYGGAAYDSAQSEPTSGAAIITSAALKAVDGDASSNEGVQASFSADDLAVGDRFSIDVFNPEMQTAKDAVIEIDNATIVKSTNTIDDAIEGVTLDLLKADTTETLTLTVSSSSASAKSSIENFVETYNGLYEFINEQMSYDPETKKVNPLLGDPAVLEIRRRIADGVTGTIPGLSSTSYTNLSHIGITSNYETGKLSIDSSKLNSALSSKPNDVARLFIGIATPSDSAITYEAKTSATQAGTYGVSISTAPEKAILNGDNDLSSTGLGEDEILTFKYSTNYTDTDATFTSFSVTLSATSKINAIVNALNSGFATNDAPLTATNNSGVLKVTSDDYGEDIWLQVTTNKGDDADNNQVWDNTTADTLNDNGVDIAGSINNHVANGVGNILTAASGFAEEGLQISTTSNQTGLFGSVNVSLGITDLLPSIIDSYVDSNTGVLKLKQDSMQDSIDDIANRIAIMGKRIVDREERLRAEFARLEVALSKYDSLAQYLTSTLTALPKIGG